MYKVIYFVGIGGIGMSGIAKILINLGIKVKGSDLIKNKNTLNLEKLGAIIYDKHVGSQIKNSDIVVFSSSIHSDNPELIEAKKRNIPIFSRAQMLAELMKLKYGIVIAGSHGKTTTSSLISHILHTANLDPTVVIGGIVNHLGSNAKSGKGQYFIAEADESDGSFLVLSPQISVVTNLDLEHVDFWKNGLLDIKKAFIEFLNTLPISGLAILCLDSNPLRDIIQHIKCRVINYGIDSNSNYSARNIIHDSLFTTFNLIKYGKDLGPIRVKLAGEHNAQNALASIVVGEELGIDLEIIKKSLESFSGVQRRFSHIGEKNNILLIDDYGHHPEEILAVLKTARISFPKRRILVLFEPHKYTRTHYLMDAFSRAFDSANELIVSDIYSSHEKPITGVNSEKLVDRIKLLGNVNVRYGGNLEQSTKQMVRIAQPGDVVITLGAGSVTESSLKILEQL